MKKKRRFSRSSLELIKATKQIITLYKAEKAKPTTLKIFKKMVSDGNLEDKILEYKRLVATIGKARKAGLIGWGDIYGTKQPQERDIEL